MMCFTQEWIGEVLADTVDMLTYYLAENLHLSTEDVVQSRSSKRFIIASYMPVLMDAI